MENREAYKKLNKKIRSLKQELETCDTHFDEYEKKATDTQRQIEEHFEQCIAALIERRDTLLSQIPEKINQKKEEIAKTKSALRNAIAACQAGLTAGILTYENSPSTAEDVWKNQTNISVDGPKLQIQAQFSPKLFRIIEHHGAIQDCEDSSTITYLRAVWVKTLFVDNRFRNPRCVCWHDNCLYVGDHDQNKIIKITAAGEVSNFAEIERPIGIAVHRQQNQFYIASSIGFIVKIAASDISRKVLSDRDDKPVRIDSLTDIAVDQKTGNLYVCADTAIRKITPGGDVSLLAGSACGFKDGKGRDAKFDDARRLVVDADSNSLIVADYNNNCVRKIKLSNGNVSTLCEVQQPYGVATTAEQTILISAWGSDNIYAYQEKYKMLVLVAGTGNQNDLDGDPFEAGFYGPQGIVVDEESRTCYVADTGNGDIVKILF